MATSDEGEISPRGHHYEGLASGLYSSLSRFSETMSAGRDAAVQRASRVGHSWQLLSQGGNAVEKAVRAKEHMRTALLQEAAFTEQVSHTFAAYTEAAKLFRSYAATSEFELSRQRLSSFAAAYEARAHLLSDLQEILDDTPGPPPLEMTPQEEDMVWMVQLRCHVESNLRQVGHGAEQIAGTMSEIQISFFEGCCKDACECSEGADIMTMHTHTSDETDGALPLPTLLQQRPVLNTNYREHKPNTIVTRDLGTLALSGSRAILCFGDSLTEGFCKGGRVFSPYSRRLLECLREQTGSLRDPVVFQAGRSGETTGQMLKRLPTVLHSLASEQLDVVLILGGTNDLHAHSAEQIVNNLKSLHCLVHRAGAATGVLTVPQLRTGCRLEHDPFHSKRRQINEELREFARQHAKRCFFVDVEAALPQDSAHADLWESDGIHLSERGYSILGELIAEARLPGILV